ncbi:MAG: hypothetical protein JKY99_02530 [Rhizobiales bacterium]|nr:hypothetical protein [Hyphomicrobiales bacterium]
MVLVVFIVLKFVSTVHSLPSTGASAVSSTGKAVEKHVFNCVFTIINNLFAQGSQFVLLAQGIQFVGSMELKAKRVNKIENATLSAD